MTNRHEAHRAVKNRGSAKNANACAHTRCDGHIALLLLEANLRLNPQAVRFAIPVGDPRMVKLIRYSASNHQLQSIGKNHQKI